MNADGSLWIRFNQTETRNGFKFPEIREKERKRERVASIPKRKVAP